MSWFETITFGAQSRGATVIWGAFQQYFLTAAVAWMVVRALCLFGLSKLRMRSTWPPAGQIVREVLASARTVFVFGLLAFSIWALRVLVFGSNPKIYPAKLSFEHGAVYSMILAIAMLIGNDAYFYWTHRLMHHRLLFRHFHICHHRSYNPTPFAAFSFDATEAVVNGLFIYIWIYIFPTPLSSLVVFLFISITINAFGHSGFELDPPGRNGAPLMNWRTTATHHDLHHQSYRYNFGLFFAWWDRLMGTEHPDYHRRYRENVGRVYARVKAPTASAAEQP